jgi:predicted aspartyl protease
LIWPYDQQVYPPAPLIDVRFGRPGESLSVGPLRAFVDTGADASVAPSRHIESLNVRVALEASLRSPWGEPRGVRIYRLDLGIGALRLPSVEVVADDLGDEIIIGRNVLNRLVLTLDGPRGMLEMRE